MNKLYLTAAKQAERLRIKLSLTSNQPVNIFDVCNSLGVDVRFVDINMEGMYVKSSEGTSATILLSALRPLSRRVFTCGHELGHHLFGHGTKIDMIENASDYAKEYNEEEHLVDLFAGLLLMPVGSIAKEFSRRGWDIRSASPEQFYLISCIFGVGYSTLVNHCKFNRLISSHIALGLLKHSPSSIFKRLQGNCDLKAPFRMFDGKTMINTVDVEVGNFILLPSDAVAEGAHICKIKDIDGFAIFKAVAPGICRVYSDNHSFGSFFRIQNEQYVGLAENRHLENEINI